jgi:putative zinc finger/helix-turn-helix YgiT family protein
MCEAEREVRAQVSHEDYTVRGEKVAIEVPRLICATCGEAMVEEAFGDPTLKVYAEYRRRHGLLSPEQIRAIREKYGLSQEAFATLLGASPATFARYEGGSLQDKAYDQLIRACDDPAYIADLVAREGRQLSSRQLERVQAALAQLRAPQAIVSAFPDLRWLKWAMYAAVVVWFCRRLRSVPQTKMYKLLFYTDFLASESFGEPVTGVVYKRMPYGPVPSEYELLRGLLEEQDQIVVEEVVYPPGYMGLEFRLGPAAVQPETVLNADHLRVLEFVATEFGRMTAKEISERSHHETAWLETPQREIISYDHAIRLSVRLPR